MSLVGLQDDELWLKSRIAKTTFWSLYLEILVGPMALYIFIILHFEQLTDVA